MSWIRSKKKRIVLLVVLVLMLMGLFRLNPTYHYSRITRDGKEIEIESFRFGPQHHVVEDGDTRAESWAW